MKRYTILFIVLGFASAVMAQQPKKVTKKFFPNPSVEIQTPSFGKQGFVQYSEMISYLEQTIAEDYNFRLEYIGETQQGNKIPVVIYKKYNFPKARVIITARIHGDEPGGTEAALYLIDRMVNDPSLAEVIQDLEIAILPMVNIDGADKLMRPTANGLDMNRDMTKLATPENRALRAFFTRFAPDVALDLHEYNPFRNDYMKFGSFGVSSPFDIMFLYSDNPNYPQPLKDFVKKQYVPQLGRVMDDNHLTHEKYFSSVNQEGEIVLNMGGTSVRSSAGAFGLSNTVSLLVEVRGASMGKISFKRRVYTSYLVALNTLKMANDRAEEIRSAIEESMLTRADFVVNQRAHEVVLSMPFIDTYKNKLIEVELPVRDAADRKNVLVRKRPYAYALLADQVTVAEKLQQLGVTLDTLKQDLKMDVERYTVSSYRRGDEKVEGYYEQHVKTQTTPHIMNLSQGMFIVRMNQRNANLAATVLEPESDNGFVRYHVLSVHPGEVLPIYRIINPF